MQYEGQGANGAKRQTGATMSSMTEIREDLVLAIAEQLQAHGATLAPIAAALGRPNLIDAVAYALVLPAPNTKERVLIQELLH